MNKLTIIGNLTRDPELRTTQSGKEVCSFSVAVNRRRGQDDVDFFRVTAWEGLAKICAQYLAKGRKICAVGPVGVHTYQNSKGETVASLEVNAEEVEFLSSRTEQTDKQTGYQVVPDDDLPFDRM